MKNSIDIDVLAEMQLASGPTYLDTLDSLELAESVTAESDILAEVPAAFAAYIDFRQHQTG